jgi:hypothetical protein
MLKTKREAWGRYLVLDEHGEGIAYISRAGGRSALQTKEWGWWYVTDVPWLLRRRGQSDTKKAALETISREWSERPERPEREARQGDRVAAVHFHPSIRVDDDLTVPPGTEGTVSFVDDLGTIFVDWDNGSTVGVLVCDSYRVVEA